MSSLNHYDVIIIGTGAGGGTLAYHLAPSGKTDPHPRARRLRAAGEGQLGPARGQRSKRKYNTKEVVARQGRQGAAPAHELLRRRQHEVLSAPPCSACAKRTSASCATTAAVSPAWPITYDDLEPYYTQAEQLYQVHGNRGEDPTEPPASAPYPLPGRQPRAANPATGRRFRASRA